MVKILFLSLILFSQWSFAKAPPFKIIKGQVQSEESDQILYKFLDYKLVRTPTATSDDFNDVYVVSLPKAHYTKEILGTWGEVLAMEKGAFAVMKIKPKNVPWVSGLIHKDTHSCGTVLRLFGDTLNDGQDEPVQMRVPNRKIPEIASALEKVQPENIRATVTELAKIKTRFHGSKEGQEIAAFLAQKYKALAGGRGDVEVSTFNHKTRTPQDSLVVKILGQKTPDEIIIIGSHIDSINSSYLSTCGLGKNRAAPGADDNGSGTATNLEIFRVIMESGLKFDRTIEIHGYAAEEIGLIGSQDMAQNYRAYNKDVKAMLQIDMNMYKAKGTADHIWFVSNQSNESLVTNLGSLIDTYLKTGWGQKPLHFGTSDQAAWQRHGYAAVFPTEDPQAFNTKLHTCDDTIETASAFSQSAEFAKLGILFFAHYAGF